MGAVPSGPGLGCEGKVSTQSNYSACERGLSPKCLKWRDAQSQPIRIRTQDHSVHPSLCNTQKHRKSLMSTEGTLPRLVTGASSGTVSEWRGAQGEALFWVLFLISVLSYVHCGWRGPWPRGRDQSKQENWAWRTASLDSGPGPRRPPASPAGPSEALASHAHSGV